MFYMLKSCSTRLDFLSVTRYTGLPNEFKYGEVHTAINATCKADKACPAWGEQNFWMHVKIIFWPAERLYKR